MHSCEHTCRHGQPPAVALTPHSDSEASTGTGPDPGAGTGQDPIAGPEPRLGTPQQRHTHRNTMIDEVQIAHKLPDRNNALFA